MKRLISLLFVSFFCFIYGFCQNVILTRNESLAYRKLEITALKITLAVYGDSITNKMLMGEIPFPEPICISFFQNHIDKIEFYEKYGKWTEALKEKFRKEIKKHIFYASADPYMSTDNFRKLWAKEGGSAYPFSLHTNYLVLFLKRNYFLNKQNPKDYQFVDYVKELIKEYDQIEIMDIDGIYHK